MRIEFNVVVNVPIAVGCSVDDWKDKITRDLQYEYRNAEVKFIERKDG